MSKLEYADAKRDRGIRVGLIRRQLQMVRSGAKTCDRCGFRTAIKLSGVPPEVRSLCGDCATTEGLDRRVERQRAQRGAMRSRT